MITHFFPRIHSIRQTAAFGLRAGIALALLYGFAFTLIAIPRASLQVLGSLPLAEGLLPMLLANAAEIYILAIQFALLFGLLAALLLALTLLLVRALAAGLAALRAPRSAALTGLLLALAVSAALQILVYSMGGLIQAMFFRSMPSYLFWLGLPCLIYIAVTARACRSFEY